MKIKMGAAKRNNILALKEKKISYTSEEKKFVQCTQVKGGTWDCKIAIGTQIKILKIFKNVTDIDLKNIEQVLFTYMPEQKVTVLTAELGHKSFITVEKYGKAYKILMKE